ncbi:MAG: SAM-dependent methyltransferase [Salinivirgaceae bacterium]|nr:SAM-dependent methyltransferase [Salinivirgaceae bacterium]
MAGKIFLLPITLGESNPESVIPKEVIAKIISLRIFIVENVRTSRRFLRLLDKSFPIDDSIFYELNKHTKESELTSFIAPIKKGQDIGIMSEAGVPGVADPGSNVVALAHRNNISVVPFVGPSSILLAVMAAGLNGQNFAFNGYLPLKSGERIKKIKELEHRSKTENQSQLFIETPYRNMHMLNDIISCCQPNTLLSIAVDITLETEFIKTDSIKNWKNTKIDISKRPGIFTIHSY